MCVSRCVSCAVDRVNTHVRQYAIYEYPTPPPRLRCEPLVAPLVHLAHDEAEHAFKAPLADQGLAVVAPALDFDGEELVHTCSTQIVAQLTARGCRD